VPHLAVVELARLNRVWLSNVGEHHSKVDHEIILAAFNRWPQIVPFHTTEARDRQAAKSCAPEGRQMLPRTFQWGKSSIER